MTLKGAMTISWYCPLYHSTTSLAVVLRVFTSQKRNLICFSLKVQSTSLADRDDNLLVLSPLPFHHFPGPRTSGIYFIKPKPHCFSLRSSSLITTISNFTKAFDVKARISLKIFERCLRVPFAIPPLHLSIRNSLFESKENFHAHKRIFEISSRPPCYNLLPTTTSHNNLLPQHPLPSTSSSLPHICSSPPIIITFRAIKDSSSWATPYLRPIDPQGPRPKHRQRLDQEVHPHV
jgi:hypothetical protein